MVDCRGFPYTTHPTGWHQVAWSDQIGPGEKLALRYFGRDLVLYRGTGGRLHLVDGHCPHMGAHLGIGGSVVGDDIICPNHGWRFDASGRNVEIPYADRPNGTSIRAWEVRESASLVLAWYSADGRVPAWEPMSFPEFDAGSASPTAPSVMHGSGSGFTRNSSSRTSSTRPTSSSCTAPTRYRR